MDTLILIFIAILILAIAFFYYQKTSTPATTGLSLYEQAMKDAEEKKKAAAAAAAGGASANGAPAENPYPGGNLTIYFGSQTGTAEEFAKTLENEGKTNGFNTKVVDLEDFEPEDMQNDNIAIFAMATYGEGDPTDNAIDFNKWIKDKHQELEDDFFSGLKYTVFGLGNRQYEHYNKMGRYIDKRLEALGGTRIFQYGEGDDDQNLDEDFDTWREELWPSLNAQFSGRRSSFGNEIEAENLKEPTLNYEIVYIDENDDSERMQSSTRKARERCIASANKANIKIDLGSKQYFKSIGAKVISIKELRQSTVTTCTKHVEIDLSNSVSYVTADNLNVCCENDPFLVEHICKQLIVLDDSLNGNIDRYFLLRRKEGANPNDKPLFPSPCSIRQAIANYCDITSTIRKSMLLTLAYFAQDTNEKEMLVHMTKKEGKDEFNNFIVQPQRTISEVLEHFSSIKIPFLNLIELLPRLQAREYTISSSSMVQPSICSVTVSVVNDTKPDGDKGENRYHRGVCSNFLNEVHVGQNINVYVKPSSFRLPVETSTPIIMVGPGTGVAPMRAFCQERQYLKHVKKVNVGRTCLFFGCRQKDEDFIYDDEMLQYMQDGTLDDLFTAFSRENPMKKVYVQNLMVEQSELIYDLIYKKNAYFYVCGGTTMGNDVYKTLEQILMDRINNNEDVTAYLSNMKAKGRYVQELWS